MVEFVSPDHATHAFTQLNNVVFFGHKLSLKHSKHTSIAAPPSNHCKEIRAKPVAAQSAPPTPFVAFANLHPIVAYAPNIPLAICHYFDHYYCPRPLSVAFTGKTSAPRHSRPGPAS